VIAVELAALLRRPRTWLSIVLLAGLPTVAAWFVHRSGIAPAPDQGPAFLSQVLTHGQLLAPAALAIVMPLFLPISVAVVAGDAIAGEASAGTLRYLLLRPVGRTRLLVAKLLSAVAFVLIAVVAVAGTGYLVGTHLFSAEPLPSTLSGGPAMQRHDLLLRFAVAVGYVAVSMLGVAAFALFFSTLSDSSLGATLGALAVLVSSQVLDLLDAAGPVRAWLPTHYWLAFVDLFRDPVLWHGVQRGTLQQGGYVLVLLTASWAVFATKDVTS
jgi:ABC-2 type transport system permease protein